MKNNTTSKIDGEKYLVIHKNTGEDRHYLILTRDSRGDSWDLPRYNTEKSLEEYLNKELGITLEELIETTEDVNGKSLNIEVTPETRVTRTSSDHRGGIFMKKKEVKQLLKTEECAQTIENHYQTA